MQSATIVPWSRLRAGYDLSCNIFINYRRGEDSGIAGRLFDRLERTFSRNKLFMDVDSIEPGLDFTSILKNQVASCEILLALIGKSWLSASDEEGRRRLANPNDFVRIEIANGLAHGKRVIPVLVGAASMPRAEDLPEELKPFAQRQAVRLTHENFNADVERLIKVLSNALTAAEVEAQHKAEEDRNDMSTSDRETAGFERRRGIPGWLWGAQALIVLALLGYWFFRNLTEQVVMQPQVTQLVSPAARSVEVTPAVPSTPARLVVNNIAGKVHYDGTVGDEQTRSSIIAAVQRVFGEENASGTITIDPAVDPANWLPKLEAVLQNFKIPGAEMLLQGNRIGLGGVIPQGDIELLKQALVSLLGEGFTFSDQPLVGPANVASPKRQPVTNPQTPQQAETPGGAPDSGQLRTGSQEQHRRAEERASLEEERRAREEAPRKEAGRTRVATEKRKLEEQAKAERELRRKEAYAEQASPAVRGPFQGAKSTARISVGGQWLELNGLVNNSDAGLLRDLSDFLRTKGEISCEPLGGHYQCWINFAGKRRDLALQIVRNGIARASGDAPLDYQKAEALARKEKLGGWGP